MPQNKKVLIIDDEIDLCLLLKSYLLRKDYDVYIYNNLTEGLMNLPNLQPAILFLDNNLPDGVGWTLAAQLVIDYPKMFIVLISAFHPSVPNMPENAHYKLIEKPISMADLDSQLGDISNYLN
jgi:DNA-binding NtrC family response regulator